MKESWQHVTGSKPSWDSNIAEAEAAKDGIDLAISDGLHRLQVKSDNLNTIEILNGSPAQSPIHGLFFDDILHLAQSALFCSFAYVLRTADSLAYCLAENALHSVDEQILMEELPPLVTSKAALDVLFGFWIFNKFLFSSS